MKSSVACPNIVNDYFPDRFAAVGLLDKAACERRGGNFRNVLVFSDCGDFLCIEPAERHAVLK